MALKGIVGIEAAIVLIAFVLVASALAFVAINMGMFSAQKSKEVMARAYDAATRSLDVAGNTLAYVESSSPANVTAIFVPIKLTAGTSPIDLSRTLVSVIISDENQSVIYSGVAKFAEINGITFNETYNLTNVADQLKSQEVGYYTWFYGIMRRNNTLLEPGEIVYLALNTKGLSAYGRIHIEVVPQVGAPLVVEYNIPPTINSVTGNGFVDLVIGR